MKRFSGFPDGEIKVVPLPNLFFIQVLPCIDSLAEAKVTLHLWWLLHSGNRRPRRVALKEILADELLVRGLGGGARPATELAKEGLERAVARGTFLRVEGAGGAWLFANDEEGRKTVARVGLGELRLESAEANPSSLDVERPNIFSLYEQNIGLLQPLIVEELREAEGSYPDSWVEEAFRIAVERNARNWRYIRAILERWKAEGKDDGAGGRGPGEDRRRYIEGEFADYIEY